MNLIKYGIASVVVTCAVAVACGGSSSNNGNGSGAGTSNSAGTSNGSGGTSSSTGGTSASTTCNTMMGSNSCPAATTCIETKCKTQFDTCNSATGPCAGYLKCATPCNCDQTCESKCTQPAACTTCISGIVNCSLSMCFSEALSCGAGGTGAGGTGAGGTFSFGGNAGTFPSFDAGTATCADLAVCCAKLSGQEQQACTQTVDQKVDAACSLTLAFLCP